MNHSVLSQPEALVHSQQVSNLAYRTVPRPQYVTPSQKSGPSAHFCFYLWNAVTKSDNFGTHKRQFIANTLQQTFRTVTSISVTRLRIPAQTLLFSSFSHIVAVCKLVLHEYEWMNEGDKMYYGVPHRTGTLATSSWLLSPDCRSSPARRRCYQSFWRIWDDR